MIYFSQNNSFLTLERLWNSSGWKITKIVNDLENNHFVLSLMQHFSQNFKVLRYLKKWYICGKISIIPIHYVSIMQLQILQLISSIIFSFVLIVMYNKVIISNQTHRSILVVKVTLEIVPLNTNVCFIYGLFMSATLFQIYWVSYFL